MRREGRLTGYSRRRCNSSTDRQDFEQHLQDLGFSGPFNLLDTHAHTRIKLSNKPTNQSKDSARCIRKGCSNCHAVPASKALSKTKGIRNKLYNHRSHGSHGFRKPHLRLDPSFFDLHDYDPLSYACDALYDEDDIFVDAYGIHHDMHDVQPDVNAHEHDVTAHESEFGWDNDGYLVGGLVVDGLNANDDHSMHRPEARDGHDSHGCLSTALTTHEGVGDAVLFPQKKGIEGALPVYNHIDDLVVVIDDHVPHSEALQQSEQSPPDCEGLLSISRSFPPFDDDGSIEWCQLQSSELESEEDDWIIC